MSKANEEPHERENTLGEAVRERLKASPGVVPAGVELLDVRVWEERGSFGIWHVRVDATKGGRKVHKERTEDCHNRRSPEAELVDCLCGIARRALAKALGSQGQD